MNKQYKLKAQLRKISKLQSTNKNIYNKNIWSNQYSVISASCCDFCHFVIIIRCKFSQCANSPYGSETLKFSKNVPKIVRLLCVALIPTTPHGLNLQKHALGLVPKARVCSSATWYDEKPEIVMNFLGIID